MSVFSVVFAVLGTFLVLYAGVSLARAGRVDDGKSARSLGCGFALLAGLVWGIALASYLDSWWAGMRLGFGLAFVLPALATALHPQKRNIVSAAVLLAVAVVLVAPSVPLLLRRLHPSSDGQVVQELQKLDRMLGERISATDTYLEQLQRDSKRLRKAVRESGFDSFEALEKDRDAYATFKEYGEVCQLEEQVTKKLDALRDKQDRVASSLRRAERLLQAKEALGEDAELPDIEEIRSEVEQVDAQDTLITVEKQVEREELRDLFENMAQ